MPDINRWIFWSAILVGFYLLAKNANSFNTIIKSLGGEYTSAIATLQGREQIPFRF